MRFTLLAALIAAAFSFLLGIFALIKNPKGISNRNFAFFNIAMAVWNVGEISSNLYSHQWALYVYRFSYIGASFVPLFASAFLWSVANRQLPRLERVFGWLSIIFAIISPTNLIIRDITVNLTQLTPIEEVSGLLYSPFLIFFISSLSYSLVLVFLAYRRSSGYLRNQLRYIMAAVCIGLLGILSYVASQIYDKVPPLYCFVQMMVCATFATAILKHRLMDITVIIRKTLIYSLVMGTLTLAYLAVVTVFTRIFEGLAGYQTVFSSAAGAVLITLCFQPLRKKVQGFVDQKFFRQYVDREEKLYELSREVITHTTPESMGDALLHVIHEALHPKAGALYLRGRDGSGFVRVSSIGSSQLPDRMGEDNELASYFKDHPQPFVQDVSSDMGQSHSTRLKTEREDAA